MSNNIDTVKQEFENFVKIKPKATDIISYLLRNTFDGPPAMVGMVQRAVRTLAEQLNASDAHFILELIQNFEDNEYGPALPTMFFHLDENKLYVACNEIGMKPADVYALCNVGDSTKKTSKDDAHGYLGEKGIGFKSIFKVAHTVQVYSSYPDQDEMWKFDLTENLRKGIGYIVPEILQEIPTKVTSVLEHVCRDTRETVGGTCLVLILKPSKIDLVAKQIKQLSPETIMFLRKINKVTIQSRKTLLEIQANKSALNSQFPVAIHCKLQSKSKNKTQQQEYLIFQGIYDMKKAPCKEREGMNVRSISIAMPKQITPNEDFRGKIFAYLPTGQETLLPFHINADFMLTASRNDLLIDHKWNGLIFEHLVDHIGVAATYLSSPNTATFVDPMQLIPVLHPPHSFNFLHNKILEQLRPLPIFPVLQHLDRKRACDCVLAPSEFIGLLKPNCPLPSEPFICDNSKVSNFQVQAQTLGLKMADKHFLESVIKSILPAPDEHPDPTWFCNLYTFMSSHDYWTSGLNHPVTKLPILLLTNGKLAPFGSTTFHQSAKEIYPLRKWWASAPMLSTSTLPKQNDTLVTVESWLRSNGVLKLEASSASQFITSALMDPSCSAESIMEATTAIFTHELSTFFPLATLPFVTVSKEVIYPPFSQPIISLDNRFLQFYTKDSDKELFLLMDKRYLNLQKFKSKLHSVFPISHAPPLPNLFSWMNKQQLPRIKQLDAALLLELFAISSTSPSELITQFLNNHEWVPTSKGRTTPLKAFIPSAELVEVFSDTVPFVSKEIFLNEVAKSSLLRFTNVNRTATVADVLSLLMVYKENQIKDLQSLLPLLKFLLEKKAKPPIPFSKVNKGEWEWKDLDNCIWVKEFIPEIPTLRTNLGESKLDLAMLKKLFPKFVRRFSPEECINSYKQLSVAENPKLEVVEKVLSLIYKRFPKELDKISTPNIWCGHFHQFQPSVDVLFNDQNSFAKRFMPNQLKLLWFPKEIETKSQKLEIATLLKVKSISTEMIDIVETTSLPDPPPVVPLFSRFVRSALCRWHYNKYRYEWDRGAPEKVQEMLDVSLEERSVVDLTVVKGVKVNGEVKRSNVRADYKSYFDFNVNPPILYRTVVGEEEQLVEEFGEYLARRMKIGDNNKESLECIISKAIRHQKTCSTNFLSKYPHIPHICNNPSSTAYLSEKDKALLLQSTKEVVKKDQKPFATRMKNLLKEFQQDNMSADMMRSLSKRLEALTLEKMVQDARDNNKLVTGTSDPFQPAIKPNRASSATKPPQEAKQATKVSKTTTAKTLSSPKYSHYLAEDDNPGVIFVSTSNNAGQKKKTTSNKDNKTFYVQEKRTYSFQPSVIIPLFSSPNFPFEKRTSAPKSPFIKSNEPSDPNFSNNMTQRDGSLPGVPRVVIDRPNQRELRDAAIARYGGCIITGTTVPELIQAAHIKPWSTGEIDVDDDYNIILLRCDIHMMLDSNPAYLYFTPSQQPGYIKVNFTGGIQEDPNYEMYHNTEVRLPEKTIHLLLEYGPASPDNNE